MYCPKCGQQNPAEAKFCGTCGTTMSVAAAGPQPQPQPAAAGAGAAGASGGVVSSGLKTGMIVASIVLPIVGIIMGIVFLLDPNPEKKAAGKLWLIIGIIAGVVWAVLFADG